MTGMKMRPRETLRDWIGIFYNIANLFGFETT